MGDPVYPWHCVFCSGHEKDGSILMLHEMLVSKGKQGSTKLLGAPKCPNLLKLVTDHLSTECRVRSSPLERFKMVRLSSSDVAKL
jgi:hypothetical protein